MQKLTIQLWDEDKFTANRDAWNTLLSNSDADPLYLSWEWQHTWWQVFAQADMHLRLYAVYDENGTLVGIAPLYIEATTTARFLTSRRLQFIGNCWRTRDTMRTELLDFIVAKSRANEIIRAVLEHIHRNPEWDEFVMANLRMDSATYHALAQDRALPGCYLREAEQYPSYYLQTAGEFADYLAGLGKHTRLRLYNRRKQFDALGETHYHLVTDRLEEMFELLNRLHRQRWGYAAFENERLEFNARVAGLLAHRDGVYFSLLTLNNRPVSIQYNYNINGHIYNIQGGFDAALASKVAPGYLHFGYELERAFDSGTTIYDFLAGEGKSTDYKKHLTRTTLDIVDLQIIRDWKLKLLYRLYDRIKHSDQE